MKKIICFFNSEDFIPVFVISSEYNASQVLKYSFADALEQKKTKLSKWIQAEWTSGNSVFVHEIIGSLEEEEAKFYLNFWKNELSLGTKKKTVSTEGQILCSGLKKKYLATSS